MTLRCVRIRSRPVFSRKVMAPDGRVWTVTRGWPLYNIAATTQDACFYAGGMGRRERMREHERLIRAIESGELDASLDQRHP